MRRSVGHMGGKRGMPQIRRGRGSQWGTLVGFGMTFELKSRFPFISM